MHRRVRCITFIYIHIHFIYISMSMYQCTENMEVLYSMIPITWGLIVAFFYLSSFLCLLTRYTVHVLKMRTLKVMPNIQYTEVRTNVGI